MSNVIRCKSSLRTLNANSCSRSRLILWEYNLWVHLLSHPSILHVVALSASPSPPYTLLCAAVPLAALFDLWPRLQVGAGGVRCLVQSLTITIRGGLTPTVWQAWTMNRLLMANLLVSGNIPDKRGLSELFLLSMPFQKRTVRRSFIHHVPVPMCFAFHFSISSASHFHHQSVSFQVHNTHFSEKLNI